MGAHLARLPELVVLFVLFVPFWMRYLSAAQWGLSQSQSGVEIINSYTNVL